MARKAWNSVHNGSKTRFRKASEQLSKEFQKPSPQKIADYVLTAFHNLGIGTIQWPDCRYCVKKDDVGENGDVNIDYTIFGTKDVRDIVWLKFTDKGYLGVVASSNDINFQIPPGKNCYNEMVNGAWKYNTSGIIIKETGQNWDTSFVLVFPILSLPDGMTRHYVERYVGNYLIDQKVAILDYYSHRFF